MEYTIQKLARLAGVSTRTLRYYDQCGLLKPRRVSSNGYRIYGSAEIDRLQQILFYRELDMPINDIQRILSAPDFDSMSALNGHLAALMAKRAQLDELINNVESTIKTIKGEITMTDEEKFKGFKEKLVADNERQFGKEIRQKFGDETVEKSNARVLNMTREQYDETKQLTEELNAALKAAVEQGDPAGPLARKACELHKQWLSKFWGSYSKEAHIGITEMYVADERFKAYYEKIAPGCAEFLREAVKVYCK